MAGLPRDIIKKYGVSKRAWSVYRSRRSSHKRVKTKVYSRRSYKMAKRKRSFRAAFRRSAPRMSVGQLALGSAGVVAYDGFVEPMIPLPPMAKDVAAVLLGLYLAKRKGTAGAFGRALATVNAVDLVRSFSGQFLGSRSSTSSGGSVPIV